MITRALLSTGFLVLMAGCVHTTGGRHFPVQAVGELNDATTKEAARDILGSPLEVQTTTHGGEVWIYRHAYPAAENAGELRPATVVEAADVIRVDELVLRFDGEVLADHELTTQLAPLEPYPDVEDYP